MGTSILGNFHMDHMELIRNSQGPPQVLSRYALPGPDTGKGQRSRRVRRCGVDKCFEKGEVVSVYQPFYLYISCLICFALLTFKICISD
jgi:hypothetical protein